MKNDEKNIDFNEMIIRLRNMVESKVSSLKRKRNVLDAKLKISNFLSSILEKIPNIVFTFLIIGVFALCFGGIGLITSSYLLFKGLSVISFIDEFSTTILVLSGVASIVGSIILGYFSLDICNEFSYFLNKYIFNNLSKSLFDKKKKYDVVINEYNNNISILEEKLKSFDKVSDCYRILVVDEKKQQLFSNHDVRKVYNLLRHHGISILIYLLYYGRLGEFSRKSLSSRKRYEEQIDIESKIEIAKGILERNKTNSGTNHVRKRRVERFHDIYDESFLQKDSIDDLEVENVRGRKR